MSLNNQVRNRGGIEDDLTSAIRTFYDTPTVDQGIYTENGQSIDALIDTEIHGCPAVALILGANTVAIDNMNPVSWVLRGVLRESRFNVTDRSVHGPGETILTVYERNLS